MKCTSVRHSPAPPMRTITSNGPVTRGSGTSSTLGSSLKACSRTAFIWHAPLLVDVHLAEDTLGIGDTRRDRERAISRRQMVTACAPAFPRLFQYICVGALGRR